MIYSQNIEFVHLCDRSKKDIVQKITDPKVFHDCVLYPKCFPIGEDIKYLCVSRLTLVDPSAANFYVNHNFLSFSISYFHSELSIRQCIENI